MTDIAAYRARGEERAQEYLFGLRCALGGWPRSFCNTPDAQRGYDQMTRRLKEAA